MKSTNNYTISKSKYVDGLRCLKLLWYEYNRKDDIPQVDSATQAIMDQGKVVGKLAQTLFPDGIAIQREYIPRKQAEKSLEAIKLRKPVFEAGFVYKQMYALADILDPVEKDKWDLIEVKSSTGIKEEYYSDVAFQKYVYENAGLKIRKCFLMYINNKYIRKGNIDPKCLFAKEDITKECVALIPGIEKGINNMIKVLNSKNEPIIKVSPHCEDPWTCPLYDICWSFLPKKDNVFCLYFGKRKAYDLMNKGILNITKIPGDVKLSEKQIIQLKCHKNGAPHIDKEQIKIFLSALEYPLYFLDFETINPAIPVYDNSKPYENIPFQYSLYVMNEKDSEPKKHGYITPDKSDPRKEILKQLKRLLGSKGSIIAYNSTFEITTLRKAIEAYPEYQDWLAVIEKRFIDLLVPFRSFFYYHPKQEGSASLKAVLPVMTNLNYEDIVINEGSLASNEYYRVTFGENIDEKERQRVYNELDKYCDLDTKGMIEILSALRIICK